MASGDTGTATGKKKPKGRPKGSKNKNGYKVTEKVLAQRKAAHKLDQYGSGQIIAKPPEDDEEKAFNSDLITHIMRIHEISQNADRHDLLSLKSCFVAYLQLCKEDGFKVSNLAAYSAMGMSYHEFYSYSKKDDPEIRAFCSFVKQTCAMFRESLVSSNKLNPVIGIFWQRNFDGLRNDTEQVQALQEQQDDEFSDSKSYKEKYQNLIGE